MPRLVPAVLLLALAVPLLPGCAGRQGPVVLAAVPLPPPPPMPRGAHPGMTIPSRLADGRYATPSDGLSAEGATWHLRAALNVAVLACRGPDEAVMAAQYNTLLAAQRTPLAGAEKALSAEYRGTMTSEAAWRPTYDAAMTRLYNFYAQDFARAGFCRAAAQVLGEAATVAPTDLPAFAHDRLAQLDRPFTDFYAAYDAWRSAAATTTIAAAASVATAPATPPVPYLVVDVAALN